MRPGQKSLRIFHFIFGWNTDTKKHFKINWPLFWVARSCSFGGSAFIQIYDQVWNWLLPYFSTRTRAFQDCSVGVWPEIYIQSAPNSSNETYSHMCLGRTGRFGQHQNCLKIQIWNLYGQTYIQFNVWGGAGYKFEKWKEKPVI